MQLKTKSGFGLVVLGIGVFAAWSLWTKTRNVVPVDVPISMAAGTTIRSEFKLNFDGLYLIEIGAEKAIPLDRLRCLMAVEPDATRCKGIPPAIGATWILSSDGQEISRGNSQEMHSAPVQSDYVARVIGEFQGRAGRRYKLQVVFTSDGRSLAGAHPRLKVGVSGIAFEDMQAAGGLILSITFICILFGAVLMLIAFFAKRGSSDAGSPA
jgi:hypothetical protein